MSRPEVSVVMPFAGDRAAALEAIGVLLELQRQPGDELILVDNSGVEIAAAGVTVVSAGAERSPAHARNVGAEHAQRDWILFVDADCHVPPGLLDAYFAQPIDTAVGALAGGVDPAPETPTLAARYGAARSFLSQEAHLAHHYRPRAVAANLMVRRVAFEQLGGFCEGVRAAEDTDFSWRLQQRGWRLELRRDARVEHRYRTTIGELRRQWRGYAAGRAWLGRRYDGFVPEPALRRALTRGWRRFGRRRARAADRPAPRSGAGAGASVGRLERGRYFALDALLAADELAGFTLSNRAAGSAARGPAEVVLIAEHFPERTDPLVDFARTLDRARVEASARPDSMAVDVARALRIDYREDEGKAARALALVRLAARHPLRCARDAARGHLGQPTLAALAPAALRLQREPSARLHPLGGDEAQAMARRLAALTGRRLYIGEQS